MEHTAFHSAAIKTGGSSQTVSGTPIALSGSGKGVTALGGGMNFFDLMFARLAGDAGEETAAVAAGSLVLQPESQTGKLKITGLADTSPGVSLEEAAAELAGTSGTETAALLDTGADSNLLNNIKIKKKFLEFLNSLLEGLPEGQKPVISPGGELTGKDNPDSGETSAFPGLVATGLTQKQLAEAMESFGRDVLKQYENNEEVQGVMVGLVKIMPPQSSDSKGFDAIILPKAMFVSKDGTVTPSTGPDAKSPVMPGQSGSSSVNTLTPAADALVPAAAEGKGLQDSALKAAVSGTASGGEVSSNAKADAAGPAFLSGFEFPFPGVFFAESNWSDPVMDKLGLQPAGQHTTHGANLTQLVTQAPQAGSAHPSTQIIAAHLQKMTAGGETRNMTLDMDPPELGRVRIRMEFGVKEKTVKAHMLVEKPETYLMLQRDSHALERALQEAGLETGEASLEFELAQDGHEFSHDGSHDNGPGYSGDNAGDGGDDSTETIETTMNWYVDPETGAQRYDLLV